MKRFSGGFSISISLLATDLECLIKNLIFNWGDIMMHVGGYHEYIEAYHEYIEGIS